MYVLNLKRLRLPLLITVVLLTAWAVTALPLRVALVSAYQQAPFVSGAWGSGSGEFGVGPDKLGKLQGPRSFVVDSRGVLLLADTHNNRVTTYDAKGQSGPQIYSAESGDWLSHIAVDGRGNVYVASSAGTRVKCLDSDGRLAGEVDLAAGLDAGVGAESDWLLLGAWGAKGTGMYAHLALYASDGSEARLVHLDEPGGSVSEFARYAGPGPGGPAIGPLPESMAVGPGGQVAVSFRSGPFGLRLKVYNDSAAALWEADLSRQSVIAAAHLIGGDSKGNFYMALEYGSTAEIVRVAKGGTAETVLEVPPFRPRPDIGPDEVPYAMTPARVDRNGNIYLAATSKEGFAVLRFAQQRSFRWPWQKG